MRLAQKTHMETILWYGTYVQKTCAYACSAKGMLKAFRAFFRWGAWGAKCVLVIKAGKGNARFYVKGACVCA